MDYDINILKRGKNSHNLFCLLGTDLFNELANNIRLDINIYGIYVHEHIDEKWTTIETVDIDTKKTLNSYVDRYTAIIKDIQRKSAYYICGYSFGGYIAMEVARSLENAGENIGMIAMIDTIYRNPNSQLSFNRKMCAHIEMLKRYGYRYIVEKLSTKIKQKKAPFHSNESHNSNITYYRMLARHKISTNYAPSYNGPVHLFRAMIRDPFNPTSYMSGLGWDDHIPNLFVHKVPGDHSTMLKTPNVNAIASILENLLNEKNIISP